MKIGDTVKINESGPILELVGKSAEIVDLQMQQYEKYRVYPIWAKMTSGERKGRIYGFREDEVELLPKGDEAQDASTRGKVKTMKATVIEQIEEILKDVVSVNEIAGIESIIQEARIKVGNKVKIRECDSIPEVVGESAEIVDLQMQQYEKYRVYPIWVKMTSGKRAGKIYGFREGEVEILPEAQDMSNKRGGKTMKKVIEQVEEILKGVTTVEEIAEIDRLISEVKGKILVEPGMGFWEGKTPCWEMFRCPEEMRNECPAFKYRSLPCWEIEGTYCKLYDYGARGDGTAICEVCRVYKRYGHGEPIQIKLRGKGFDTTLKAVLK